MAGDAPIIEGRTIERGGGPPPSQRADARSAFVPEIQALRAVAVAAVVVYHLWPAALPAGFTGVDVFFVISGFLITSHMLGEHERSGRLDVPRFFARRARRILPAAIVVVVVTALVSLAVLPQLRWADLTRHGTASLLYVQNWALAGDAVDYLSEGSGESPFRHFWSLAVEEQFYIVWPVLFVLLAAVCGRRGRRIRGPLLGALCGVVALSFAINVAMTSAGDPGGYFVSHARVWELGLGAVLAATPATSARPGARRTVAVGGWAAILLGMILISRDSFPGVAALVPTLGAVAVIWAARGASAPRGWRWVSARPVQWLGGISYSLYLWHWPVLIWAPFVLAPLDGVTQASVVLVVSLVLAALSRRYVEVPFHRRIAVGAPPRAVLGAVAVVSAAALLVVQLPGWASERSAAAAAAEVAATRDDPPEHFGAESLSDETYDAFASGRAVVVPAPQSARSELPEGAEGRCKSEMGSRTTPRCDFGAPGASMTVALVGDSHMEQYLPAFQTLADDHDLRVVTYFHSSCPYSTAQRVSDAQRGGACLAANEQTTAALLADPPEVVVTSNRTAVDFVGPADAPRPAEGFVQAWEVLRAAQLPVVVLADNPLMLPDDETVVCVIEHLDRPEACERPAADALPVDHQVAAAAVADVDWVDTSGWFCTETVCPAVIGSVLVHRDEQHLTPTYVRTLAPRLWSSIERYAGP